MTTNVHFSKGTISEQYLYEDLVIEAIGIYGHDVFYLPRTLVNEDELLGEDPLSKFSDAYGIEMWMETQEGYEGEKDIVTRFGLDIQNETSFVVSRRRWDDVVSRNDNLIVNTRPDEGDLIYFPAVKRLWIISFVDHDEPFHQLENNPVYKLRCRLYDYSSEVIDTGIAAIDAIEDSLSVVSSLYQITLEQSSAVNENIRLDFDGQGGVGLLIMNGTDASSTNDGDNIIGQDDTTSVGESVLLENSADTGDKSYLLTEDYIVGDYVQDKTAQNELFDSLDNNVLDFSESNPFGDAGVYA